jgi:fatty-acyl-CoA synthase
LALFNTSQQGRALEHSISASQVTMAITEQVTANCWNGLNTIPLDQLLLEADRNTHVGFQETALGNNAAFYIFTSGTTGLPKASIMSHVRWLKAAYGYGYGMLRLHETDVLYNALPLYHNLATTIAWGSCVATGACFAISERFSASAYWDECRASGATCVSYIGELPRYLLAQPESARDREHRVRLATGVGLRHSLWNEFKTRFGIERVAEFYGSSEGNTVFLNLFGLDKTVGFSPTPHKLVAYDRAEGQPLRNQQGQLIPVKHGDAGLLLSRVTKRFPYDGFTDTQASEKRLYRSPFGKGHTYVDSGDLLRKIGYGHAVFVDRVGDSFRWKGENVATAEVEAILDQVSYIRESTAYGITLENTDGTPGMATIACDKGMFDPLALYQHCRTHLPEYAVPVFLRIQRDLERTGTFKHQRAALRTLGLTRIHESVLYQRKGDFPWRPIGDTEN